MYLYNATISRRKPTRMANFWWNDGVFAYHSNNITNLDILFIVACALFEGTYRININADWLAYYSIVDVSTIDFACTTAMFVSNEAHAIQQ